MSKVSEMAPHAYNRLSCGVALAMGLSGCTGLVPGGLANHQPTPGPSSINQPTPRPPELQTIYDISLNVAKGVSAMGAASTGLRQTTQSGALWQTSSLQAQALATQSLIPAGFPFMAGGNGRWLMDIDNGVGLVHLTLTFHRLDGTRIKEDVFDSGNYMPILDPITGLPAGDGPLADLVNGLQPDFSRMKMRIADRFEPFLLSSGVRVDIGTATSDLMPLPIGLGIPSGPQSLTYHYHAATLSFPAGGNATLTDGTFTVTEIQDQGADQGVHDFRNAVVKGHFDYRFGRQGVLWSGQAGHDKFGPRGFSLFKNTELVAVATRSAGSLVLKTPNGEEIGPLSEF